MPWPVPLWTVSGAMTWTSPSFVSSRYIARMPGAWMPSSLVRRMSMFSQYNGRMFRLTRAQVREVDRRSIEEFHIPGIVLMENAAKSAAAVAMEMSRQHRSALIFCGGGNNGGDGLAIARHLRNAGWLVDLILANEKPYAGDARTNFDIIRAMNVPIYPSRDADIHPNMLAHGFVVDALYGTG